MKTTRYILPLLIVLFLLGLSNCSAIRHPTAPIAPYPAMSNGQVALLIIGEDVSSSNLVIVKQIDQKQIYHPGTPRKTHFELLPGKHTVTYFIRNDRSLGMEWVRNLSSKEFSLSFVAEAEHTYALKNYTQWGDTQWDDIQITRRKVQIVDFLTMIIDQTQRKVAAWQGKGKGDFRKNIPRQTGLKLKSETQNVPSEPNRPDESRMGIISVCENDYCEPNETHENCPTDCFPIEKKPTDLSEDEKAVYLDFVYKGQKSGIFFIVHSDVHYKLTALPRSLSYTVGRDVEITKKDFILKRINNNLQKENLVPLIRKIETLTPNIHKQARIAISLVQNIPYQFPSIWDIDFGEKYPYGVIWEQDAVCSEKSDLSLFLLRELGFGTVVFIFKNENHRAVGIKCPESYSFDHTGYCFVEVTGPRIITDSESKYLGGGKLTDYEVIEISDGIELQGVEEEYNDKILFYELSEKAKSQNGLLERSEYNMYMSILDKYGMKKE